MRLSRWGHLTVAAAALCASSSAMSSTDKTATFLVSLTVSADCTISTNALAFGTATSALATSAINQSTTLSVSCSSGTGYTLSLDAGDTSGSTVSTRLLAGTGGNTDTVQYQLYSDTGRTTVWGDSSGGSTVSGTGSGSGSAQTITIYGQVPAQTLPAADSYSATETATVTF